MTGFVQGGRASIVQAESSTALTPCPRPGVHSLKLCLQKPDLKKKISKMNVVQKKKKWVGYHDNLQEEVLVTLHYFLVLLNSPTGHRPFEGCGWQP